MSIEQVAFSKALAYLSAAKVQAFIVKDAGGQQIAMNSPALNLADYVAAATPAPAPAPLYKKTSKKMNDFAGTTGYPTTLRAMEVGATHTWARSDYPNLAAKSAWVSFVASVGNGATGLWGKENYIMERNPQAGTITVMRVL